MRIESFASEIVQGLTTRSNGGLDDGRDRTSGEDVGFDRFESVGPHLSALIFYDNVLISSLILSVLSPLHCCADYCR